MIVSEHGSHLLVDLHSDAETPYGPQAFPAIFFTGCFFPPLPSSWPESSLLCRVKKAPRVQLGHAPPGVKSSRQHLYGVIN
jgi:hypothetical protein